MPCGLHRLLSRLIGHQPLDQDRAVGDHIGERDLVEFGNEGLKPGAKQHAELADPDQGAGIALGIEAFDQFKVAFGVADHFADHNVFWCAPEPNAAAATTNIFQITQLTKLARRLQQMRARNAVSIRHIFHTDQLAGMQRTKHKRAQRIICVGGQSQAALPDQFCHMRHKVLSKIALIRLSSLSNDTLYVARQFMRGKASC